MLVDPDPADISIGMRLDLYLDPFAALVPTDILRIRYSLYVKNVHPNDPEG